MNINNYKGWLDKQLEDPKFKKSFDKEYFVQTHLNTILCSLEDSSVPYDNRFVAKTEKSLRSLYKRNNSAAKK